MKSDAGLDEPEPHTQDGPKIQTLAPILARPLKWQLVMPSSIGQKARR